MAHRKRDSSGEAIRLKRSEAALKKQGGFLGGKVAHGGELTQW